MSESDALLPRWADESDDTLDQGWIKNPTYRRAKQRTAEGLESSRTHKFILAFITIDACCVFADLVYTVLSPTCTPAEDGAPAWLEALSWISLVITCFFVIEIPLTVWALGWKSYWPFGDVPHAWLHLFDASVITITFVLEVVLRGKERELAGLLIILRLWRLVKLVGGFAVGAGEVDEARAKELDGLKRALRDAEARVQKLTDQNNELRQQTTASGAPTPRSRENTASTM